MTLPRAVAPASVSSAVSFFRVRSSCVRSGPVEAASQAVSPDFTLAALVPSMLFSRVSRLLPSAVAASRALA